METKLNPKYIIALVLQELYLNLQQHKGAYNENDAYIIYDWGGYWCNSNAFVYFYPGQFLHRLSKDQNGEPFDLPTAMENDPYDEGLQQHVIDSFRDSTLENDADQSVLEKNHILIPDEVIKTQLQMIYAIHGAILYHTDSTLQIIHDDFDDDDYDEDDDENPEEIEPQFS